MTDRYARQIAVPSLGASGHAKLRAAKVLVIGAGGLAAPVLQYLVGAGVGHIRLVDADHVSISNLHRQTLFRHSDLNTPKVLAAQYHMAQLNPECQLEPIQERFDPANATGLCAEMDLVLDCADSFAASYVASDTCTALSLPLIAASVVGTEGYCGGFCGDAPGLRAVFPDLPDRLGSCDADGVLGPSVGVIGALQAQMAIAVLTRATPSPLGQLITYDAAALRFGGFRFDGVAAPEAGPAFIASSQIVAADHVIDLRAPTEPGPTLPRATRLTVPDFTPSSPTPPANLRVVLACRSGLRAWQAAERLREYWSGEIALVALGET